MTQSNTSVILNVEGREGRTIIQVPTDVIEFVQGIAKANPVLASHHVFIGGGYVRDIFTGKQPKDIDIFFVPQSGIHSYQRVLYVPAGTYVNYRLDSQGMPDGLHDRGVFEVTGLFNSKLSTTELQYIVYKEPYFNEDVYALAKDMDMNICQIMLNVNTLEAYCTQAFVDGHLMKQIKCESNDSGERKYHRFRRMAEKFPDYELIGAPKDIPPEWTTEKSARANAGSFIPVDS